MLPELKIETDDKCKASPLPAACEFTHKTVNKEKEGYLELSIISVFEPCEKEPDESNRTSCFIQVIKNGPYNPPFRPQNCERLKDYPEARDTCYETIADKLEDPKLCDFLKGAETFQCVYLRAKSAGNPEICKSLKMNRFHHSPQDRLDQIDACLNTVKRK